MQQVIQHLVDDMTGEPADETVPFALDSKDYEIDLNDQHASQLREILAPYVAAARRAGGSSAPRRQAAVSPRRDLTEVRAWLAEHSYPVKERGRIPEAWFADFEAKTPNPPQGDITEDSEPDEEHMSDETGVPELTFQAAG